MACSGNQGHRELVAGVVLLEAFLMRRVACSLDPIAGYGYGGAHLQEVFEGQAGLFGVDCTPPPHPPFVSILDC